MKSFITCVVVFSVPFLNGMSKSLQCEMVKAEDAMSQLFDEITPEKISRAIQQLETTQKRIKQSYPRGIFTAESREEITRMMNLETDLKFLTECQGFLLGGEETEAVGIWGDTAYEYQLILSNALKRN